MKKSFIAIVLSLIVLLCGCNLRGTMPTHPEGGLIYNNVRYIVHSNQGYMGLFDHRYGAGIFVINYETPVFADYYTFWFVFPSKRAAYFSEFDTEKNIMFDISGSISYIWFKEGFELPDLFECRINKMTIGDATIWETENEFFTLNEIIGEKIEYPGVFSTYSTKVYFEDYKYLTSKFSIWIIDDNTVYISISRGAAGSGDYYTVKPEYADMFREK